VSCNDQEIRKLADLVQANSRKLAELHELIHLMKLCLSKEITIFGESGSKIGNQLDRQVKSGFC
jgi:hypothetical protein